MATSPQHRHLCLGQHCVPCLSSFVDVQDGTQSVFASIALAFKGVLLIQGMATVLRARRVPDAYSGVMDRVTVVLSAGFAETGNVGWIMFQLFFVLVIVVPVVITTTDRFTISCSCVTSVHFPGNFRITCVQSACC